MVVILQTSVHARNHYLKELREAGFTIGKDFTLCCSQEDVASFLHTSPFPSLIVVGTISGNVAMADEFSREVKKQYPQIPIAWFSTQTRRLEEPYSLLIPKGPSLPLTKALQTEMRRVLDQK